MAALLTIERHDTEKVGVLIAECRRMGIEVLPPSVNVSSNSFTIESLPPGAAGAAAVDAFPFPVAERAAIRMGLDADQERRRRAGGNRSGGAAADGRSLRWPISPNGSTCGRSTAAAWNA